MTTRLEAFTRCSACGNKIHVHMYVDEAIPYVPIAYRSAPHYVPASKADRLVCPFCGADLPEPSSWEPED